MTEPLYVGGAGGYDELFARVTRSFIPALLGAARILPVIEFSMWRQGREPRPRRRQR